MLHSRLMRSHGTFTCVLSHARGFGPVVVPAGSKEPD